MLNELIMVSVTCEDGGTRGVQHHFETKQECRIRITREHTVDICHRGCVKGILEQLEAELRAGKKD